MLVRLQKFLADAGIASRRASEQIILDGRVTVNRRVVSELGSKVDPARDLIAVDDQEVKTKRKLYVALNKPQKYISARSDPTGRSCITELLPKEWNNLYPVGRLDYDSEGLIFLTNDGNFSLHLTHPRYGVEKKYLVTVEGRVGHEAVNAMLHGVYHDGERLKAERIRILQTSNSHSQLEFILAEGKNREVRRLCESQNLVVERLQRVQIGPIKLGELKSGRWRMLTEQEIKTLMANEAKPPPLGRSRPQRSLNADRNRRPPRR